MFFHTGLFVYKSYKISFEVLTRTFLFNSALIVTRFPVNWQNKKIPFSWSMCSIFKMHAKTVSFSYKKCTIWFQFLWQGFLFKIIPGDVLNFYSVTVCLFYALLTVDIIPNIKYINKTWVICKRNFVLNSGKTLKFRNCKFGPKISEFQKYLKHGIYFFLTWQTTDNNVMVKYY